jgi:DNA-directed RNA polymerase specialized sigma24 family protein
LITAREVEGISFDELEIMTGKSAGSLRTQVSRIRESLRKEFSYAA